MAKDASFPKYIVCPFCGVSLELEPYERYIEQLKCVECQSTISQNDVAKQLSSKLKHCDACDTVINSSAGICPECGKKQKKHSHLIVLGALLVLIVVFAINRDNRKSSEIAGWVKGSIQDNIHNDEAFSGLRVGKVALVREMIGKNTYSGYVVFIYERVEEKVKLSVSVDANGTMSYRIGIPQNIVLKQSFQHL